MRLLCTAVLLMITTLSRAEDDGKMWRIQMNIPKMLMNLAEITGLVDKAAVRSLPIGDPRQSTMTIEVKPPNLQQLLTTFVQAQKRSSVRSTDTINVDTKLREDGESFKEDGQDQDNLYFPIPSKVERVRTKKHRKPQIRSLSPNSTDTGRRSFGKRHRNRRAKTPKGQNDHKSKKIKKFKRTDKPTRKGDANIGKPNQDKVNKAKGEVSRRAPPQFYVEVGPGAYKSEQVSYEPNYLKGHLFKLMSLKVKRDERLRREKEIEDALKTAEEEAEAEKKEKGGLVPNQTDTTTVKNK